MVMKMLLMKFNNQNLEIKKPAMIHKKGID